MGEVSDVTRLEVRCFEWDQALATGAPRIYGDGLTAGLC